MNKNNYLTYTLFFFFGVSFQYGITLALTDKTPLTNDTSNTVTPHVISELEQSIIEKISLLDYKIDTINYTIEKLSSNNQTHSSQAITETSEAVKPLDESEHSFKDNSIVSIKDRLYSNLSNPMYTLPDILESEEMTSLSQLEQQQILTEIARRIDSGEIDKSQFLPGYSERSAN